MNLQTPVCEQFGISRPIFGFSHSLEVTAAITNAGGLGVWGATRQEPDKIGAHIARIKQLVGDRPFGVDVLLPQSVGNDKDRAAAEAKLPQGHKAFVAGLMKKYNIPKPTQPSFFADNIRSQDLFRDQVEAILESDAPVFAAALGVPPDLLVMAREAGKKTIALVGAPRHAEKALAAGVDLLVAQGHDAGAHTGKIGTFTLVPQIVDAAGKTPVIVAGGVGHGRHLAAALAMGAQGVWMGTAWLATKEHEVDELVLKKLLAAKSEDTLITRTHSGKPLRMIRSGWSDEWGSPGAPEPLPMPYQQVLVGEIFHAIREHRIEPLMWYSAGQSIAYYNEVTTVDEVMDRICDEAEAALAAIPMEVA